jgi:hypothetical protein
VIGTTAKLIRLGAAADQNAGGSSVPKSKPARQAVQTGHHIGQALGGGIASGITASTPVVQSAADRMLAQVNVKFSAVQAKLTSLKQQSASVAQGITGTLLGQTGIGALGLGTDSLGASGAIPTSAGLIVKGLRSQDTALERLRRQLRSEHRRGLSARAEQDIAGLGLTQAGGVAGSLTHASRRQLQTISQLEASLHGTATGIGRDIAGDMYSRRISELTDVVKQIRQMLSRGHRTLTQADYQQLERILGEALHKNPVVFDDQHHRQHRGALLRTKL